MVLKSLQISNKLVQVAVGIRVAIEPVPGIAVGRGVGVAITISVDVAGISGSLGRSLSISRPLAVVVGIGVAVAVSVGIAIASSVGVAIAVDMASISLGRSLSISRPLAVVVSIRVAIAVGVRVAIASSVGVAIAIDVASISFRGCVGLSRPLAQEVTVVTTIGVAVAVAVGMRVAVAVARLSLRSHGGDQANCSDSLKSEHYYLKWKYFDILIFVNRDYFTHERQSFFWNPCTVGRYTELWTYDGLHDEMDICKLEDLSGLEIWAPASLFIHLETICARGASSAYDVTRRPRHTLHATGWRLTKVHCRWVRGKGRGLEGIKKICSQGLRHTEYN